MPKQEIEGYRRPAERWPHNNFNRFMFKTQWLKYLENPCECGIEPPGS